MSSVNDTFGAFYLLKAGVTNPSHEIHALNNLMIGIEHSYLILGFFN
jgi:hypothetical protein